MYNFFGISRFIILLFLGWNCMTSAQTLLPISDTDSQSDVSSGTNNTLNASQWCHLFIKFDLGGITSKVSSASFRLYQTYDNTPYLLNVCSSVPDNWTEGSNKPSIGDLIGSMQTNGKSGYKEVDITAYVQDRMASSKIVSLAITTDLGSWTTFFSRENGLNPPQLLIITTSGNTYSLGVNAVNGYILKTPDHLYYNPGDTVSLQAMPYSGCSFEGWSGDTVSQTNPITFIMNADKNLTATFTIPFIMGDSMLIDPQATASTRQLWRFLRSVYGKKLLTGCWTESQFGGNDKVKSCTGQTPAIWGQDMSSWYRDRTDPLWNQTWDQTIQGFKTAWARGQILQLNWHWQMVSSKVNGVYTRDAWGRDAGGNIQMMTDQEWNDLITPGTVLYNSMIEDIDYHVTHFLKKITDESGNPIPILFRPLHEIDGGWFWWTCSSDPSKTVRLFKILQDRIINYHGVHNLIWVWNNGTICSGGSWPPFQNSEYNLRRAYYPGDSCCDLAGIDLYDFDPVNRGSYAGTGKTYRDAWTMLKFISPKKMLALCECEGLPDAGKCFSDENYAPWLYALPWFAENYYDAASSQTVSLCDWNNLQFNSTRALNAGVYGNDTVLISPSMSLRRLRAFPNPLKEGNLQLELQGFEKDSPVEIHIYEITGKDTGIGAITNDRFISIARKNLVNGIYLVRAQSSKSVATLKLVVE